MAPSASLASSRHRRPILALLGAGLLLVAATLAGAVPRWRARTALALETRALAVPSVRVVRPKPGNPPPAPRFPAEIRPFAETSILSRASGYVRRWTTDIGGQVKAGDLLVELDSPELDQELARTRQEFAQADAGLLLARSTSERYQGLAAGAGVSEQEVAEKAGEFAVKSAAVDAARSNLRRLEKLQSFTRIRAPFAGVITVRRIDVGDLIVGGGGRELFRLAQSRTLRVSLRVPQSSTGGLGVGQAAEVFLPDSTGKALPATVARTAGALSPDSRTLLVELELANPRGEILAGGYAEARLLGPRRPASLTLPANTLLFREEGPRVGVVGPSGHVELRAIRLGRDFGRTIEVLDGLRADDAVILNPSDSLADGAVVQVAAERVPEGRR
jgi:RND family efflux transporter MFP subunit